MPETYSNNVRDQRIEKRSATAAVGFVSFLRDDMGPAAALFYGKRQGDAAARFFPYGRGVTLSFSGIG